MSSLKYTADEVTDAFNNMNQKIIGYIFDNIHEYVEVLHRGKSFLDSNGISRTENVIVLDIMNNVLSGYYKDEAKYLYEWLDVIFPILDFKRLTEIENYCIFGLFVRWDGVNQVGYKLLDYVKDNNIDLSLIYPTHKEELGAEAYHHYMLRLMGCRELDVANFIVHMDCNMSRKDILQCLLTGVKDKYINWLNDLSHYIKDKFSYLELNNDLARFFHVMGELKYDEALYGMLTDRSEIMCIKGFFEKSFPLLEAKRLDDVISEVSVIRNRKNSVLKV